MCTAVEKYEKFIWICNKETLSGTCFQLFVTLAIEKMYDDEIHE